jgi:hypothetical protein
MELRMGRQDSIPIKEWEDFLALARRAGASNSTMVEEEAYDRDPDIVVGFKIETGSGEGTPSRPAMVSVPTNILHDLIHVAREVASSDGDVRGLEATARETLDSFYDYFLEPTLGPNPWIAAAKETAEEDARTTRDS